MKLNSFKPIVIAMLLFSVASLSAKYDLNSDKEIPLTKDVRIGTLPNGFKYYIRKNSTPEKHGHFRLVLDAGAIQEDDDQNGLAHFTEHMCFNGTKNYPKNELLDVLQKFGIRFGADVNASTGFDRTMYELPIPVSDEKLVKESFKILADWAGNVTMDAKDIDEERGIIISEWRQRMNVFSRMQEKHYPVMFFNSKYAKRNLIGDTAFLSTFKPEQIRRFYDDWYRPNLMALVAVGDFDVDKIEKLTKEYFGGLKNPKNNRTREKFGLTPHKDTKVSIVSDKEMPFEMATIITKLPKHNENTYQGYALTLKKQIYDVILNYRLQEITNGPNPPFIAAGGGSGDFMGNTNAFFGSIRAKNGGLQKAVEGFLTEVARIKQHGINPAELERAKTEYSAMLEDMLSKKNTTKHDSYVNELTSYFADGKSMGGVDFDYEFIKQILAEVTPEEIAAVGNDYLTAENTVITVNLPEKDDASKLQNSDMLTMYNKTMNTQLAAKVETTIDKPLFNKVITNIGKIENEAKNDKLGTETFELSNGAKVILKKTNFKDNEVLFGAYSWGGNSLYSNEDYFSADLATAMVSESGISEFSKTDFDKVLAGKIVGVNPYINDYFEGFSGQSSTKDLEYLFQIVNLFSSDVRMDKDGYNNFVERIKPQLLSKGQTQDDIYRDSVTFILGNHHFRSQPFTMDFLNKANYDRGMQIFKDRFSNLGDFTYVVVGDFDPATVKQYFAKYIGSVPKGQKENYKDLKTGYPTKASKTMIYKGDDDKAHIRMTMSGNIDATPKNRMLLSAVVDALEIRLIETIREKLSATYSPSLWVQFQNIPTGQYAINIDMVLNPKEVDKVKKAVIDLINSYKSKPDEVATDKVKKALLNERDINLINNNYWMGSLVAKARNNEDPMGIIESDKVINAMTAKDLQATAKKYINTNKIVEILAMPEKK